MWTKARESASYIECCDSCWEQIVVFTQDDNHPEYYTTVEVACPICKEWFARFNLPVN